MRKSIWLQTSLHLLLGALLIVSIAFSYAWQQLMYKSLTVVNTNTTFVIAPGTSLHKFALQLKQAGIYAHPNLLSWYAMAKGYANSIKIGEYKVEPGMSAADLLDTVVDGKVIQYAFTIVEGWRSVDAIKQLHQHPKINAKLAGLSNEEIIQQLNLPITNLEGMFFPDTYYFTANTSDIDFLRRAYFAMQKKLQTAWDNRAADSILQSPYEALILASIIEKESGMYDEFPEISGVFQRRISKNMRLQADPTVIYALGAAYTGQILKQDLQVTSPYNTYANSGLPPTPIALPSLRAIEAALHPTQSDNLYFVASGNGRHVFSTDLVGHNQAVGQFRD